MRLALLAVLLLPTSTVAQPSNWHFPTRGASVSLTADKPFFEGNTDFGVVTSAWSLSTVQPVLPLVRIVGNLPFAVASFDIDTPRGEDSETSLAVGNLEVGVEADLPTAPVTLGAAVRVPTATASGETEAAQFAGLLTDYERLGAYLDDVVTLSALAETRFAPGSAPGLSVRLRALPQVFVPTGDESNGLTVEDTEVALGYAAQLFLATGAARVGAGVTGVTALTGDDDDRTQLFLGAMADLAAGPFRPGVVARVPISGNADNFLNAIIGLRVTYVVD